ncbi:MAG: hypothetical protein JW874_16565 [Spirochaetales bacterium]|nr:hypothetical protein [Spirochaetales bacterium]
MAMNTYAGGVGESLQSAEIPRPLKEIERGIIRQFRKQCWIPFTKALRDYLIVNEGDTIAACVSGGKDSLLMAKLLQELQRHGRIHFTLKFISMDPGFSKENQKQLEENCSYLNIPAHYFKRRLFETVDELSPDYPCYLCAKMRRGALYATAQELGCNKIALGHHFDDVIETILLNVLCAGKYQTMMPKLKSTNFPGMELVRPLYYIREDDIKAFFTWAGLSAMDCGCVVTAKKVASRRREIKELIKKLGETFRDVDKIIFQSSRNVYMDAVIEWIEGEKRTSFLDGWGDEPEKNQ